jgi:predicted nucleic acid-binding protein
MADLAEEILLPDAVADELLAGPVNDSARLAVAGGWGQRSSARQCPSTLLEWGLGAGETSVLAVALEHQPCTAVLDDAAARAAARTLGIPVLGTIGVVLRARQGGLIASVGEVILELRQAGLYIDDVVVSAALHQVGEQ